MTFVSEYFGLNLESEPQPEPKKKISKPKSEAVEPRVIKRFSYNGEDLLPGDCVADLPKAAIKRFKSRGLVK